MPGGVPKARWFASHMAADPTCWYCGCEVVWWPGRSNRGVPAAEQLRWATREHVFTRHARLARQLSGTVKGLWVLACLDCNVGRGHRTALLDQARARGVKIPAAGRY
jgi:hypothetical protein